MDLLRLDNLVCSYGDFVAFQAESLRLEPGAIGLLGPNGAGKSTLLKVLLGLLPPSRGNAELLGLSVRRRARELRGRIGYVSENDAFVHGVTAIEFVALAGRLQGLPWRDARRRAHEVLAYLAVDDAAYRATEDLPTGVRQRIHLAQALVHDPELLVLDEPTNGLDPAGRSAMLKLVQELHRDFGKSVILSSHLLNDVESVCESVVIVSRGRVLAAGRVEDLAGRPRGRYRLTVRGPPEPFSSSLQEAGAKVESAACREAGRSSLLLSVPDGFPTERLFGIADRIRGDGPDGGRVVICALEPVRERLADLFQRVLDEATPS